MSAPTLKEQLEAVENAIYALTKGGVQSYSIGGKTVTKIDLTKLMQSRKDLKTQMQSQKGNTTYAGFRKPV